MFIINTIANNTLITDLYIFPFFFSLSLSFNVFSLMRCYIVVSLFLLLHHLVKNKHCDNDSCVTLPVFLFCFCVCVQNQKQIKTN